jgi:hypothetical protein
MRTAQRATHARVNVERDWAQREGQTLQKRLQLKPEQITQLQPILAQTADQMRQVKLETARQIAELIKQNSSQVTKLLDDGQKKEFVALIKERQQHIGKTLVGPKAEKKG